MKTINGEKMFDGKEVREMLNISQATLTRLRKKCLIKSVNIGKFKYTSETALNNYIKGNVSDLTKIVRQ